MKRTIKRYGGLLFLALALMVRFIFSGFPEFYEALYFDRVFPFIRDVQALLYPIWILPGYALLILFIIIWLIIRFPRKHSWKTFLRRLLNLMGGFTAVFLLLFGYMYLDKGFADRSNFPEVPEMADLPSIYLETMNRALEARNQLGLQETKTIVELDSLPDPAFLHEKVWAILQAVGYSNAKHSMKFIKPEGTLRRLGISGIYNPYTGESNVDAALPSIHKVFVSAHELAHSFGISSEAEANFVAYLALVQSDDPLCVYAGEYALWRQIAGELMRNYSDEVVEALAAQIPEVLQNDRIALYEAYQKHKAYFPELTDAMNDTYLKVQGIEKGTDDYDRFLQIYLAWRLKEATP